ncbi:unnamed protein product [Rotaria sp. Silwood2]|nr:unnamed protein product [Rotaria sp. Silwood2]CAF4689019.1 unnamed protein product [Rotaria sp. Silwood2]
MSDEEPPRHRAKRKPQVKPIPVKIFSSNSGRQWTSKEPPKKKVPIANILRQRTGVGRPAADIQTLKEAFQLLIIQEMILLLVKETNRRAHLFLERWSEENSVEKSQWRDTDLEEMWAFIGLLLLAGVHRAKNETLDELWSMINGRPIFRATMTKNRFKSLLQFCRFDNTTTREERLKVDKLAAIRDLWTMFLARLQICYTPGGSLTVDEQLIPTRDTAYPLNAEVYLGRQPGAPTAAKDKDRIRNLVKQLVHPWINTGPTIITDNYYTSAELAEDLLGVQTTLVGTI